jgi:23S rRNA-/tRNA-specific pseudouridylate synthase
LIKYVREFPRQALHAAYISFCHHKSKKIFEWSVKIPQDMQNLQEAIIKG